jgi:hypothetical protein
VGERTAASSASRAVLGTLPCLLLLAGTAAGGQAERIQQRSVARAADVREAPAIAIDGRLDEPAWVMAEPIADFVQRQPDEGGAPSFRTEARVAFDGDAIYVGMRAWDAEPERIASFLTRRDIDSPSDWLGVLIDSYNDDRTAYQFSVNPAGVKWDRYWFDDGNNDTSWDAVWDVAVTRMADGWCAEFRIPFSQLRFNDGADRTLGFAVLRDVARTDEIATWPLIARSANGYVSQFGALEGVAIGGGAGRLELVPYTVAQLETTPADADNPLHDPHNPGGAVGLDLRYAVTPALNLTATLNPDFGQVEADPATVNLSAFETFFREQRPFFVEGSGTYQFDLGNGNQLFYSRRIGRAPQGSPDVEDDGFSVEPRNTTILGAAKLTGRVGAFSVGALSAATQEEQSRVAEGLTRRTEVVEPRTFYTVARARREFANQSSLGFMLTSANRQLTESVDFLPSRALVGGLDYDWRPSDDWSVSGYLLGSTVAGSADAITRLQRSNVHSFQRPDASHVALDEGATSLQGHGGRLMLNKIGGARTRGNIGVQYLSPGFDNNDLGFQRRADLISQFAWLQIFSNTPGRYVRSVSLNFNQWHSRNFDGDTLDLGGNVNAHWSFQNLWSTGGGVNFNKAAFDDRLTRGGPGGYRHGNVNAWHYLNTSTRLPVSLHWDIGVNRSGDDTFDYNVAPSIQFRPTSSLSGALGVRYDRNRSDAQWVERVKVDDEDHYVFGHLDQATTALTARVNYTITPNLSIQVYGEPFVSSGVYADYKELVAPLSRDHGQRYAPFVYDDTADFNVLSFRTTNVLRWEFSPGSSLFVVWQQGREDRIDGDDFRSGRDYGDLFRTPPSNTLLIKIAHWLNF